MDKRILCVIVLLTSMLYAISVSAYTKIEITKVEINGIDVTNIGNDTFIINKDSDMEVKVNIYANEDVEDVVVEAFVRGAGFLEDISDVFNVNAETNYVKKLILHVPSEFNEGDYQLITRVESRDGIIASKSINLKVISKDRDKDGVPDSEDKCVGTILPEKVLTRNLQPKHYADIDGDRIFETRSKPKGPIMDSKYTLKDTYGCSCEQILKLKPVINNGEYKFGCTQGTINWFSKLKGQVKDLLN